MAIEVSVCSLIYIAVFSPDHREPKIPELHLGFNQHRYNVSLNNDIHSTSL